MTLIERFGWSTFFESSFQSLAPEGLVPARVLREERESCLVVAPDGEFVAETPGRLRHAARSRLDLAAVGDWVALRLPSQGGPALIQAVLPRRNRLARKVAGGAANPQVLAANVDVLLVVMALDGDFNLRRLECYAALAWESEALPLVVLTKSDACADAAPRAADARDATGADVIAVSAATGAGVPGLVARVTVPLPGLRTRRRARLRGARGNRGGPAGARSTPRPSEAQERSRLARAKGGCRLRAGREGTLENPDPRGEGAGPLQAGAAMS
jgi:hypothetical protein